MSRLVEKYIRQAFEDRNISEEQSEKLWRYYYRYLSKAVDLGYNSKLEQYDPKLALSLKYNIAEFSAFKETSFKKQIETVLTQNGRVLSWSEFKAEADKLNTDYNRRWLQTEYHQTIANAQAAEKFQGYIAEKSVYPNLKYRAINDERTREKHRVWDGLVLPVEHPFWQKHLPPNDWGCRCYVEQTAEPVSGGIVTNENIKEEFANNPALSGTIFGKIPYEKTLSDAESKQVREKVKERVNKESKKKEETWETIPTNSGAVRVSSYHGKNEKQENIEIASYFANKYNYEIDLLGKSHTQKTPDVLNKTLGIEQEYKRIEKKTKSAVDNALRSAKDQADDIVLDIKADILDGDLKDAITNRVNRSENIKTITIIRNGSDQTYAREDILKDGWNL
ncbi:phage minor head protein [Capnocytophaga cynodegmi]|uniref:phage minor head protein n=1 Tax=Capnocytophaga cynodegmi TaxID=28189 RepID=UPI0037D7FFE3